MKRTIFSLAIMLSLFVAVLLPKEEAHAWTTSHLTWLYGGLVPDFCEDGVYNYDFRSDWVNSSNVDWPVNLVFVWTDCESVEDELWGHAGWPDAYMWNWCSDGSGGEWHGDQGTKDGTFGHMRPYAPYNGAGYSFFNWSWGPYCVGSSHVDTPPQFGWSEDTEEYICDILAEKNYCVIWEDYYNFQNPEDRTEFHWTPLPEWHRWQSDGWASMVWFWA